MEHRWKVVEGKTPTSRELVVWTEGHWITFLQFLQNYIVQKDENWSISVTKARWHENEQFLTMPDHPFQEFLFRINQFSTDPMSSEKKFYYKLSSMMKFVLGYLKKNPSKITGKMKEIIEPNPRLNWCLTQTKIVTTGTGIDVVVPDHQQRVDPARPMQEIASYQQQMVEATIKVTNLLTQLIESVKPDEIAKMPIKDRLMAIGRMSYVFTVGKNFKPGKLIFKQLNIHAAGREELEAAMMDFNKEPEAE